MKVGLYSPYLDTFGGGERYVLSVGEFFLDQGASVDIFTDSELSVKDFEEKFGLRLDGVRLRQNIFSSGVSLLDRYFVLRNYDLLFYLSDGSIPTLFGKRNILHFQTPFNYFDKKTLLNKFKLRMINKVVTNSFYTKKYIDRTYGINSQVLYPPVDTGKFSSFQKENIIISVGRFFSPSHPKKQEVLIDAFRSLFSGGVTSWRLVLVGATGLGSSDKIAGLQKSIGNLPVKIVTDANFADLKHYLGTAKIYWHAAGFGEDLVADPSRAEHFGISIVEAMAAGCVPVVFRAGGPTEIIEDGVNGVLWSSTEECVRKTEELIGDQKLLESLGRESVSRASDFSKDKFTHRLSSFIS